MGSDFLADLLGEWSKEVNVGSTALKVVLALIMATVLGCERARNRHAAGLRTFIVVSLGSTLASIADLYFIKNLGSTTSLLSAFTIVGIAIISSNTILYSSKSQLKGLTTSMAIWATSIIAVTLGLGLYTTSIIGFVALMLALVVFTKPEFKLKVRSNHFEIHLELKSRNCLQEFTETIRRIGLRIDDIEINPAYANSGLGVYSVKLTIVGEDLRRKTHEEIINALSSLDNVYYIEEMN